MALEALMIFLKVCVTQLIHFNFSRSNTNQSVDHARILSDYLTGMFDLVYFYNS